MKSTIFILTILFSLKAFSQEHCSLQGTYYHPQGFQITVMPDQSIRTNLSYGEAHKYYAVTPITKLRWQGGNHFDFTEQFSFRKPDGRYCTYTVNYHLDAYEKGRSFDLTGSGPEFIGHVKIPGTKFYKCINKGIMYGSAGTFSR